VRQIVTYRSTVARAQGELRVVDSAAPVDAPTPSESPHRVRIIDGTLACLARHGTVKTTVDDIARESGVSRATVYRAFPGGRDEILGAVVDTEMARLFSALGVRMGNAGDLTTALVGGIVEASSRLGDHAALRFLVEHEPGMILGHLAFDESDRLLVTASRFTAPFLARWMSTDEAERVAEWATRIVLSYAIAPSEHLDLCDEHDATRLVTTFMLPGIEALHGASTGLIDITPFPPGGTRPSAEIRSGVGGNTGPVG
jgi:AcrR family transcriptional regulator